LADSLEFTEIASSMLSLVDSLSSSGEDDVEIHTEDTGVGIILDSQINMLFNTETEVALIGEVLLSELVFLDLEGVMKELLGLFTSAGNMNCNLLISLDGEGSDSVFSL